MEVYLARRHPDILPHMTALIESVGMRPVPLNGIKELPADAKIVVISTRMPEGAQGTQSISTTEYFQSVCKKARDIAPQARIVIAASQVYQPHVSTETRDKEMHEYYGMVVQ